MRRTLASLALLALACDSGGPMGTPVEDLTLPKGFLFGTATAGFQVEAGCPTEMGAPCEDRNSDWYQWVTDPRLIADKSIYISGDPISDAPGFYELYAADLDRAQNELHHNALRLSLEWSRIFPTSTVGIEDPTALKAAADPAALAYYHALFAAMKQRGLTPLVTINHYTLPSWIHDAYGCHTDLAHCAPRGWLDHDTIVHEIAKYAGFVGSEFGGEVDRWATLNEPFLAVVFAGYVFPSASRTNPPGVLLQTDSARQVFANEIEAHARMYDAVKAADTMDADGDGKPAEVGMVYDIQATAPSDPTSAQDQKGAQDLAYLMNQMFLDGVVNGDVDTMWNGMTTHHDDYAHRMDFLGVNYYAQAVTEGTATPVFPQVSPLTDFSLLTIQQNWDYPKGIDEVLEWASSRYHVPLYVTETGVEDAADSKGSAWIVDTMIWTKRAIAHGADVRGYFYWSLMDNFEWNHGMNVRMGLYAVDKNDMTKTRTARKSVATYARIAQAGAVPADLAALYPAQ